VAYDAHATSPERRQQTRTSQYDGRPVGLLRRADGARPELRRGRLAPPIIVVVELGLRLGNVERVALSVAEPVEYARSQASVLHSHQPHADTATLVAR